MKHVIVLGDIITLALAAITFRTKNDFDPKETGKCTRMIESPVK
jgi:hypothetical protein